MIEIDAFYTVLVYEMSGVNFSLKFGESLEVFFCVVKMELM